MYPMKSRKLLMIPGPIEFEPKVLQALGTPTTSHVAPNFIASFGNCIELMRKVWQTSTGQPFVVAGSGTLAMDMAAANLIEPNDHVLVISTGYFGERFAEIAKRYGANVTILASEVGNVVALEEIEKALSIKKYKLVTITHVDTSTGVLVNPKPIAELCKKYDTLSILDGVCSVAGEEIKQEEWGIDVVLTASQKAVGVPPGLALLVVSQKAMTVFKNRKTPVSNYYADFTNWLPIMQAYENKQASYFGTPPALIISFGLAFRRKCCVQLGEDYNAACLYFWGMWNLFKTTPSLVEKSFLLVPSWKGHFFQDLHYQSSYPSSFVINATDTKTTV